MRKIDSNYLKSLSQKLDIERIKTSQSEGQHSLEGQNKRDDFIKDNYRVNGEYYYNRELQNRDFEILKDIYIKSSTNFFILNTTVKDIIYKWPEKKKSIEHIIKEEREKLHLGGSNSYSNKLHDYMVDGKTVNEQQQDDLTYREFDLPKKYSHSSDIERDPIFSLPKFSEAKKMKP